MANHFLDCLSAEDRCLLSPHLRSVQIAAGEVLHVIEHRIGNIYFPRSGILSLIVPFADGRMGEAGIAGFNTVVGGIAALVDEESLNTVTVQIGGMADKIGTGDLKRCVDESPTLQRVLRCHEQALSAQTIRIAACNAVHTLQERLCRWLLQCRDLLQTNDLPLTHDMLALMLGVRRTSLTLVAGTLQRAGLVKCHRGRLELVNVDGIKDACCECYQAIRIQAERLIGRVPTGDQRTCR